MPNIEEKKDHRTIEIVFLNEAKKKTDLSTDI